MRITLITVGKIKEKYFTDAIAEYQKRLSRYCKLEILEVADEKTPDGASAAIEEQIKEKEAELQEIGQDVDSVVVFYVFNFMVERFFVDRCLLYFVVFFFLCFCCHVAFSFQ